MGQRIRTRWIDSAEYDLGQGEPSKFTRVELLDDSVGIYRGTRSLKAYPIWCNKDTYVLGSKALQPASR